MKQYKVMAVCLIALSFSMASAMLDPFQEDTEFTRLKNTDVQELVTSKNFSGLNKYLYDTTMLMLKHKKNMNQWRTALGGATADFTKKVEMAAKNVAMSPGTIADMLKFAGVGAPAKDAVDAATQVVKAAEEVKKAAKGSKVQGIDNAIIEIKKAGKSLTETVK